MFRVMKTRFLKVDEVSKTEAQTVTCLLINLLVASILRLNSLFLVRFGCIAYV